MTTSVHVICGPAGSGKTRHLIERYRTAARSGFGTCLWLGPTRRSVDALRERMLEVNGGLLAPHIFTFQDFAEEIIRVNDPTARPLSNVQRRLLADDIVAELHSAGELSHFGRVIDTLGFAAGVFALLKELKRNEIWPGQFVRAAYRKADRGASVARTLQGKSISVKERQCARIYARYQQYLWRHNLFDLEGRFWYARDLLSRGLRKPFESLRAVFVDGFVDFTRTERDILASLCSWIDELWIALPDEEGELRGELFTRTRNTLTRLRSLKTEVIYLPVETPPPNGGGSPEIVSHNKPAGLVHLERQLFRPLRDVNPAADAEGVACIEAPGMLGEGRMVARQVKTLLIEGVPAEDILVTMRDLPPYADLLREVFREYGIPIDVEGAEPLQRNPAIATLLRAVHIPEEDYPFAGVTALLRSGYFRPDWPDTAGQSNIAQHAEVLLRLLGEPRSREAYLKAVREWAEKPRAGLEDEQAEESRRARIHELAKKCRPFLERLLHAWDRAPQLGRLEDHASWLRHFADDLGITRSASDQERDRVAWQRLWQELDHWVRLDRQFHGAERVVEQRDFLRRLHSLVGEAGLARTPRGPGRVRILSADLARGLEVPYLFVMGLGERSFPRLAVREPFFDESERQAFRQAGLDFPSAGDVMPDEMLLFYQLVTRARRKLVLSYPAVDSKGQDLLPSSFLKTLLNCFATDAVGSERREMLIDRYDSDQCLSPAEYRVRVTSIIAPTGRRLTRVGLPEDLAANLETAATMAHRRFDEHDFNPYDGMFQDPAIIADVGQQFGPDRIFSPTALEDYIACPFRFFLGNVLRLEPLEEPSEEIEVTRRGQAFHRALSRLHTQLQQDGIHEPTEAVDRRLLGRLAEAVAEYVERAPSPASKVLWQLEGQRMARVAARYRPHWQKFRQPWAELKINPQPSLFEVDFGLPAPEGAQPHPALTIRVDDIEVQISGRIDRVDVAKLEDGVGFWIIDYKTGRPEHYTGKDLAEFRRLQLTLYALAVEQVLLAGQRARPLGLAYWLVSEKGPRIALPKGRDPLTWFNEAADWPQVRTQLQRWVATLIGSIRQGVFALKPRSDKCTETCSFSQVCRITQSRHVDKKWELALPVISDK